MPPQRPTSPLKAFPWQLIHQTFSRVTHHDSHISHTTTATTTTHQTPPHPPPTRSKWERKNKQQMLRGWAIHLDWAWQQQWQTLVGELAAMVVAAEAWFTGWFRAKEHWAVKELSFTMLNSRQTHVVFFFIMKYISSTESSYSHCIPLISWSIFTEIAQKTSRQLKKKEKSCFSSSFLFHGHRESWLCGLCWQEL